MHSRMGSFNQQVRQGSATNHPVTPGVGIGSTFNGTLAESARSGSDSIHLTVDLNIPYVPDDGNSEVYRPVGFDVNDMMHNQHWVGGRKRKAPEGTTGGISMSGTSRTVSPITSESLPEDPMDLLNGISATVQPFIQSHSSSLHPLSPQCWMTNSSFMEASSVSHIPSSDNAGSSLQTNSLWHAPTASSFQSTHFAGVSWTDLLESNTSLTNFLNDILSALEYQTNAVIQPSSGPVVDLTTSGVGDLGRTANFLGHFMNNEIGPAPLPIVTGESVAADNEEMLVPAGDAVMELGQRDNPIVIEDDEEDEHEEDQPADDQISVGNMSYEELLALQEHVGYVKTGLRSTAIDALLMRHRYYAEMNDGNDSCCICLDTYKERAKLGRLDCGHEFHYRCIWKWLRMGSYNSCGKIPSVIHANQQTCEESGTSQPVTLGVGIDVGDSEVDGAVGIDHRVHSFLELQGGPVGYLTENGARDSRRTAKGCSLISEIIPPPLFLVIGETVTADNASMLVPADSKSFIT